MKVWKVLGLAGLAGVAATGAIVARNERRRTQMTPEEIRDRLQQRYATAAESAGPAGRTTAPLHDETAQAPEPRHRLTAFLGWR